MHAANLQKIFRRVLLLLPVLVLINIGFSYFTTDPQSFKQIKNFSYFYFGLSLVIGLIPWFTHAIRLFIWTGFVRRRVSFAECLRICVGSDIGAAISPTAVGGSPVKAAMLINNGVKTGSALVISFITAIEDTLYYLLSFVLVIGLSIYLDHHFLEEVLSFQFVNWSFVFWSLIIGSIVFVLYKSLIKRYVFFAKVRKWIKQTVTDMRRVLFLVTAKGKLLFLFSFFLNLVQWVVRYVIIYILLLGLGVEVNIFEIVILGWFVYFAMLFIPTPGAVLGAEAAFYLIFSSMLADNLIGLVTFGWRFLTFYYQLTLGAAVFLVISLWHSIQRRRVHHALKDKIDLSMTK